MTISTKPMTIPIQALAKEITSNSYMSYAERLAKTVDVPATDADINFGEQTIPVGDFQEVTGMSLDTWRENVKTMKERRHHCRVGGASLSLVEFEQTHPNIELGKE